MQRELIWVRQLEKKRITVYTHILSVHYMERGTMGIFVY